MRLPLMQHLWSTGCATNQGPVDGKAVVATQAQAVDLSCQWKKVMPSHRIQKGDEEWICVSQPNLFCWDPQILDELDFVLLCTRSMLSPWSFWFRSLCKNWGEKKPTLLQTFWITFPCSAWPSCKIVFAFVRDCLTQLSELLHRHSWGTDQPPWYAQSQW